MLIGKQARRAGALITLWRDAIGPGFAVGPNSRTVDYLACASRIRSSA